MVPLSLPTRETFVCVRPKKKSLNQQIEILFLAKSVVKNGSIAEELHHSNERVPFGTIVLLWYTVLIQ